METPDVTCCVSGHWSNTPACRPPSATDHPCVPIHMLAFKEHSYRVTPEYPEAEVVDATMKRTDRPVLLLRVQGVGFCFKYKCFSCWPSHRCTDRVCTIPNGALSLLCNECVTDHAG